MKRVSKDNVIYAFGRDMEPVMEVDPGERLLFETWDARRGTIRSESDKAPVPRSPEESRSNPATGPVYVRGAMPGDGLVVAIEDIKLVGSGWMALRFEWGVLKHRYQRPVMRIVQVEKGEVVLGGNLRLPVRPMVGVIGTAPAEGKLYTMGPGDNGSNMDNNRVVVGAEVHLPVSVPGALLALGDVHAAMGDGEISGTGVEISAEVMVRIDVVKGESLLRPYVETSSLLSTYAHGPTVEEAMKVACEDMAALLNARWGLSLEEASLFLSARGDVAVCQACNSPLNVTVRCDVPKIR